MFQRSNNLRQFTMVSGPIFSPIQMAALTTSWPKFRGKNYLSPPTVMSCDGCELWHEKYGKQNAKYICSKVIDFGKLAQMLAKLKLRSQHSRLKGSRRCNRRRCPCTPVRFDEISGWSMTRSHRAAGVPGDSFNSFSKPHATRIQKGYLQRRQIPWDQTLPVKPFTESFTKETMDGCIKAFIAIFKPNCLENL